MDLSTYLTESQRTLIDKGKELNLFHSSCGVITEVGEFIDIIKREIFYGKKPDIYNICEELGDIFWYAVIPFRELNMIYVKQNNLNLLDFSKCVDETAKKQLIVYTLENMKNHFCRCNDSVKKSPDAVFSTLETAFMAIYYPFIQLLELIGEYYGFSMEKILQVNIDKLKVRFPDKFSNEKALNRDLEAERIVLEKPADFKDY